MALTQRQSLDRLRYVLRKRRLEADSAAHSD